MKPFRKILFPVDLSDVSPKIAPWVIMMAEQFAAEIYLLFVARKLDYYIRVYMAPELIKDFSYELIRGAKRKIEEFTKTALEGYSKCKASVAHGEPAYEILDYITSEKIDLVIMGSHGRKGLDRVFFGSVADRVVKMSPVPVLTINPYRA
jgi:nucleotide-binding universal stress UspA family protein